MSDDHVMVKPVRTYLEGPDFKHLESEPYRVSCSHAQQLRANGLVVHVEGDPDPAEPVRSEPEAPAALVVETPVTRETTADPAAPRRRGRPPKAR